MSRTAAFEQGALDGCEMVCVSLWLRVCQLSAGFARSHWSFLSSCSKSANDTRACTCIGGYRGAFRRFILACTPLEASMAQVMGVCITLPRSIHNCLASSGA